MARTWTLTDTLNLGASSINDRTRALTLGGNLYFNGGVDFFNNWKIWKWDGSTLSDITGTNFPGPASSAILRDICIFNGELYLAYGLVGPGTISAEVWKYSGAGTSWTLDEALVDETATPMKLGYDSAGERRVFIMDADANRLAVVCEIDATPGATTNRLATRNTGGTWQLEQMPGSNYYQPAFWGLVGNSKGSDYGELLAYNTPSSSTYRVVKRGSPWTNLSGSNIGNKRFIGYADGKSFFTELVSSDWVLKYSTDWGVTLNAAGGLTANNVPSQAANKSMWSFKNLDASAIMLAKLTDQAYVWDSAGSQFVADGTVDPAIDIYDFFVLNNNLYALCSSTTSANHAELWLGGSLITVKLYQGLASLAFKSDIPVAGVDPGGMAVDPAGRVWVGSNGPAGQMLVRTANPWTSWTDLTGSIPGSGAVRTVHRVPYEVKR